MTLTTQDNKWFWRVAWGLLLAAFAQVAQAGIAVTPLKQELALRPGEQGTVKLTLTYNTRNEGEVADIATLSMADIDIDERGGVGFKDNATMPDSAGKWIQLGDKRSIPMQPGESQTIEFSVTPPFSTPPGEYYSAIIVTMANRGKTEQGVSVQFRIASGIFVTILGRNFPKQASIAHCEMEWPATPSTAPAIPQLAATQPAKPELPKLSVLLKNTGKARFVASGKMILLDANSRIAYTTPLKTERAMVFGGDSRIFEAPLTKPLPAGKYTARVNMDYESTWSRARYELPVEILPEQAKYLASIGPRGLTTTANAKIAPERLAAVVPAGATRRLAMAVTNMAETPVHCLAKVGEDPPSPADAWIDLDPDESTISKMERKSLQLNVHIPPETPAGKYATRVALLVGTEGSDPTTYSVPVEIEVRTERSHD